MSDERHLKMKSEWEDRAKRLGSTKRAVLLKRLPGFLNESIHRRHVKFILDSIPKEAISLLDAGCGYGRLAREVKAARPGMELSGIELSSEFARTYEEEIGSCFNGSVLDYRPERSFDAILIVTLLMYLNREEQVEALDRLWSFLNPGGVVICIEPAVEIVNLWRRLTGKVSASPTGGSVDIYTSRELWSLFSGLGGVELMRRMSVLMLPGVKATAVHHGLAVRKMATGT